jgi:hypothetical protein
MASVLLTVAGSAIGNAILPGIGGPLLASLGAIAGGAIDNALFGTTTVKGPRLDALKVQDSSYGNGIPVMYGNVRVAGNVIWTSDLQETLTTDEVGGKGGGGGSATRVERASYSVDCAVALGLGPIGGIETIWADGKVIYSDGVWKSDTLISAEFYTGTASQDASPTMQAALGADYTPAYRGIAYVVLHHLQLANFGNRLPNLTFEVRALQDTLAPSGFAETSPALVGRADSYAFPQALPPIPLQTRGANLKRVLVGGVTKTGNDYQFTAVEYDVNGDGAVELSRTLSDVVTTTNALYDLSWALSPDGQHVACMMQHLHATTPITLGIYDIASGSFGPLLSDNLSSANTLNQLIWLDAQRFMLPDTSGTSRGVRVYAASGLSPVYLGFTDVWGAGSSSTRFALPFAQFTPLAGGAFHIMADAALNPTALYGCSLIWQNDALYVGSILTLSTGMPSFTALRTALISMSGGEVVLMRSSSSAIRLMSFIPGFDSLTVTRAWTSISSSPLGNIQAARVGNKIGFLLQQFSVSMYRYGEITLTDTSFTLSQAAQLADGDYSGLFDYFSFWAAGNERFFVQGADSSGVFGRVALFERVLPAQSLEVIVADILNRAGYEDEDYSLEALADATVIGYALTDPMAARAALAPLQAYQPFDLIESDGVLKARLYDGVIDVTPEASDLRAAREDAEVPPMLSRTRSQELDVPMEVDVDYIDPALDYQKGSQRARRLATYGQAKEQLRLPMVCTADKAKQVAEERLYRLWAERENMGSSISRRYAMLDPGDVVSVNNEVFRLTSITFQGGIVQAEAVSCAALASEATADGGQGLNRRDPAQITSLLFLMDLPLLRRADDQPGFYAAISGGSAWPGAALCRSSDDANFSVEDTFRLPAVCGMATSVLADAPGDYMDRDHSVVVAMRRGTLSSCSNSDLLAGANAALLGDEIIQFQTAALNADGSYTLSNLLRARRGTESATAAHVMGERFVLLQHNILHFVPLAIGERGRDYTFRAVSVGQDVEDVASTVFTPQMKTLQPLSPVHLIAMRDDTGDAEISWIRRARKDSEWMDYIDVPLDEDEELYDVEILDGSDVVRTFSNVTGPSQIYTAADQTTDFGSPQSSIAIKVYQIGTRYGRGAVARANV